MTSDAYRSPTRELGALERRHRSSPPVRPIVALLAVFGAPGVALLTGFQSERGQVFAGDRATNTILGVVFVGAALAFCVAVLRKATLSVAVHAGGFVWSEGGARRTVLWHEIAGIRAGHVVRRAAGREVRSHRYMIVLESGRELLATHLLTDAQLLAARVERELEERLLPSLRARREAGETVTFGPVKLTAQGIATGDGVVTWERLAKVEVEDGDIVVREADGKALRVPWATVMNAKLFLALARERAAGGLAG
jgi:hypothetical protein